MKLNHGFKNRFIYVTTIILFVVLMVNQYLMINIVSALTEDHSYKVVLTGEPTTDAGLIVFSKGVPDIYGPELEVAYEFDLTDQNMMDQMIKKMETFDRGDKKITLTGDKKERYKDIGIKISCEFCCSAKSIIRKDGESACGCAHSAAMRGLMAYLLEYHADQFTNDEILRELARWKALYFPKQMMKKYAEQAEKGTYTHDIAALLLDAKFDKNAVKGTNIPLPSDIEALPDMAGGC